MIVQAVKDRLVQALSIRGRRMTRLPLGTYLDDLKIDCVMDVGANKGQFGKEIRRLGYRGRIESFEPLSQALSILRDATAGDANWRIHDHALGRFSCTRNINVSANLPSSSFLSLERNPDDAKDLSYIGVESVRIEPLDDIYFGLTDETNRVYMKIDTQGFERDVIEGSTKALRHIVAVQMETSLVVNYTGETLIEEMIDLMRNRGFTPWWIMDGFRDPRTLQLLQADVFFVRDR